MKILVISSGGTICCNKENAVITPTESIDAYNALTSNCRADEIEFYFEDLGSVPSENNNGARIAGIANAVTAAIEKDYDGIILLHGTDTLQYTAAATAFVCGCNTIPVIIVSSNYILADSRTNGFDNFNSAVDFIINKRGCGVFVAYKNTGDDATTIHRASRLLSHKDYDDALYSIRGQYYGKYEGGIFISNPAYREKEDETAPFGRIHLNETSDNIMVIQALPGLIYPKTGENTKAVLIRGYHSGTLPKDGLIPFLADLKAHHIPCFLSGHGSETYESAAAFGENGIINLPTAAFPAQYMKLWLAQEAGLNLEKTMATSLGGDIIP